MKSIFQIRKEAFLFLFRLRMLSKSGVLLSGIESGQSGSVAAGPKVKNG